MLLSTDGGPNLEVGGSRKGFPEGAIDLSLEGQGNLVTKGEEWPRRGPQPMWRKVDEKG